MAKTAKAPKGFYTAKEVMQKLGIGNSTLYSHIDAGRIKKVVPPNRKEGYYLKSEIDRMVRAKEAFMLQYATDPSIFEKASEEDIEGITDLCIELFGKSGTASYEARLAQYHKNRDIFYVLRQDELIVGYIGIVPLKDEAIKTIMLGMEEETFRTGILNPENITQFKPGEAGNVFIVLGVRQGLPRSRHYGFRIISNFIEVLENFARKGVIIKKLYGTSRTRDGINLAKGMEFKEIKPAEEKDDLLRFELDLEITKNPLFKKYQQIVKRAISKN